MDVHLSPEKEARLQALSARTGRSMAQLISQAVDLVLEDDERKDIRLPSQDWP